MLLDIPSLPQAQIVQWLVLAQCFAVGETAAEGDILLRLEPLVEGSEPAAPDADKPASAAAADTPFAGIRPDLQRLIDRQALTGGLGPQPSTCGRPGNRRLVTLSRWWTRRIAGGAAAGAPAH